MHHIKKISLLYSPIKRHLCNLSFSSKTDKYSLLFPWNKKILKIDCRQIHSKFCLQSSEVAAEKQGEDKEVKDDSNDETDSKIGKYVELASDSEQKKKIMVILMEHRVAELEGKKVPSKLSIEDMKELLTMYSFSSRMKYFSFLFERETRREAEKRKKELKKKEREVWLVQKENEKPPEHIAYGIGRNTMVLRVRKKSIMRSANQRLANSILYGQKFIIDMDYDCFMRKQDCNNCGEQLLELYSSNRKSVQPFDLYFCNVDLKSATMNAFQRFMPNLYAPDNFITLSELSYLDLFPKERLVYINPCAKEPLKAYDPNAIYILGGLVDKCIKEPVVLAKAKREGVRVVHLPYDEYLMWGRSNKSLPLNHILEILLEMKATNDWNKAFRYVPQRKLIRSLDLFSEF